MTDTQLAFQIFGTAGMELLAEVPKPEPRAPLRPLVRRCACGRQISASKIACRACWQRMCQDALDAASAAVPADPDDTGSAIPLT